MSISGECQLQPQQELQQQQQQGHEHHQLQQGQQGQLSPPSSCSSPDTQPTRSPADWSSTDQSAVDNISSNPCKILEWESSTLPPRDNGLLQGVHVKDTVIRKKWKRRNVWGNQSYADMITNAINSSPEKRLTLAEIYDWVVQNVEYFKDKGSTNSSAGWKNSIRHNLSLHSRFIRIANEGSGRSSYWMLNPKASHLQRTLETARPSHFLSKETICCDFRNSSSYSDTAFRDIPDSCDHIPTPQVSQFLQYSSSSDGSPPPMVESSYVGALDDCFQLPDVVGGLPNPLILADVQNFADTCDSQVIDSFLKSPDAFQLFPGGDPSSGGILDELNVIEDVAFSDCLYRNPSDRSRQSNGMETQAREFNISETLEHDMWGSDGRISRSTDLETLNCSDFNMEIENYHQDEFQTTELFPNNLVNNKNNNNNMSSNDINNNNDNDNNSVTLCSSPPFGCRDYVATDRCFGEPTNNNSCYSTSTKTVEQPHRNQFASNIPNLFQPGVQPLPGTSDSEAWFINANNDRDMVGTNSSRRQSHSGFNASSRRHTTFQSISTTVGQPSAFRQRCCSDNVHGMNKFQINNGYSNKFPNNNGYSNKFPNNGYSNKFPSTLYALLTNNSTAGTFQIKPQRQCL